MGLVLCFFKSTEMPMKRARDRTALETRKLLYVMYVRALVEPGVGPTKETAFCHIL